MLGDVVKHCYLWGILFTIMCLSTETPNNTYFFISPQLSGTPTTHYSILAKSTYNACGRYGWGMFLSCLIYFSAVSSCHWEMGERLKYHLSRTLNPKQAARSPFVAGHMPFCVTNKNLLVTSHVCMYLNYPEFFLVANLNYS